MCGGNTKICQHKNKASLLVINKKKPVSNAKKADMATLADRQAKHVYKSFALTAHC